MKLNCSVKILNRLLPNLNIKSAQSFKNAVLAVMKPPDQDIIYMILITSANKSGVRYKIKGNIEKTFGQFRNEGKTTIRFKEPPHDIYITADQIQLKNFMLFIKKVWENDEKNIPEINKLTIPQVKSQSVNKMDIKTKSQYPVLQGFPGNLQILNITNCFLKRIDNRILKLKNLTTLCLDKNNLTDVPVDLKKLALKYLSLSKNKLGKNIKNWNFLSKPLLSSLEYLDLSDNEIRYFPTSLVRANNLKVLKLSNISAFRIPFRLCLLPNLQELDLSNNRLLALPGTVLHRHKKLNKLDISGKEMLLEENQNKNNQVESNVPSLLELSIRATIDNRLPYSESTLPQHLLPLLDSAKLCKCGKSCVQDYGSIFSTGEPRAFANTFVSSLHSSTIPIVYQACCTQHFFLK